MLKYVDKATYSSQGTSLGPILVPSWPKLDPRYNQVGAKLVQFGPNWVQLKPSWHQVGPSWSKVQVKRDNKPKNELRTSHKRLK